MRKIQYLKNHSMEEANLRGAKPETSQKQCSRKLSENSY